MLSKFLGFLFWITDIFDKKQRHKDPATENKRARERRLVASIGLSLLFFVLSSVIAPGALAENSGHLSVATATVQQHASLVFGIAGCATAIWSLIEMIGYWKFMYWDYWAD